jgi:hypothetical protein
VSNANFLDKVNPYAKARNLEIAVTLTERNLLKGTGETNVTKDVKA